MLWAVPKIEIMQQKDMSDNTHCRYLVVMQLKINNQSLQSDV